MDVTGDFYAGDAFIGYGAEFRIGQDDGSPETFTAVPDVNSIVPGDATTGTVDTTHLRSPNRHRERKLTLRDSGPFTLNCNYRPDHGAHMSAGGDGFSATHNVLVLWENCTEFNFEIELPADAQSPAIVMSGRGGITKYQVGEIGVDQKVPVTIEITPLRDYDRGV